MSIRFKEYAMHTAPPLARAGLMAVVIVIVQGLLVAWFGWPATHLEPRDVPVVVAGPAPAAQALAAQLNSVQAGAFAVTMVADEAAADAAVRNREAYAAFVISAGGAGLHLASAASPAVAALLSQAAAQAGGGLVQIQVTDIVPAPADDPRGGGFASGFLPLVLTSLVIGALLGLVIRTRAARLFGVLTYTVLAGLGGAAVLHWLGVLTGDYLADAGAVGLLALAVSASVAGLAALMGPGGAGLGALLIFVVGNPISGVAAAPELLPRPWGEIGQWLPPGAGATLLRSVSFFDGAGATFTGLVLAGWAAVGLLLLAVSRPRPALGGASAPATEAPAPAAAAA
jgi:hypothetical protein